MKDFKILKFLDMLRPLIQRLGIDYGTMRKILQVKLIMDGRRVPTAFINNNTKKKTDSDNNFFKSLWVYILMGLILIPFVFMKSSYIYQMSVVFAVITFFVMSSLISDFSSVLLDIRDRNIIGTKPVSPKTLSLAKTIHITIYMFYITAALTGPALLVSFFTQGVIFALVFLLAIVLLDMFIIVMTSLVYFLVLRFFDGEKLKDIINYIQIILSIVITVGYQLVGRLFGVVDLKVKFIPKWWQYFIVPIWFSAPFEIIKKSDTSSTFIIFTAMAIMIPLVSIVFYMRLMPVFERNLQKLSNNHENSKNAKRKPAQALSRLMCRSREERIFFRFASDMMKNEREFKLKVYPTLGFSIVFPFIFIFQRLTFSSLKEISQGNSYFFIYFCGMMLPNLILMTRFSEKYKGAWIYKSLPIKDVVPIFKGTIKAFTAKLFIPTFLFEAVIFTGVFGVRILPDLLVVFIILMVFNILCFMAMKKSLPFSESFESAQQANGGANLLLVIVLAVMGGIHFGASKLAYGSYILLATGFIANLILWRVAFNVSPGR